MLKTPQLAARIRYQAETEALLARVARQPSSFIKTADDFLKGLKNIGFYQCLDVLWMPAATGASFAYANCISASYGLTPVDPGNLTLTPFRGVAGNASSSYLATGYAPGSSPGQATQDDNCLGCWTRTNSALSAIDVGNAGCAINAFTGTVGQVRNMHGTPDSTPARASAIGHLTSVRTAGAGFIVFENGVQIAAPTRASQAPTADELFIGARNNGGSPASFTGRQQSLIYAGRAPTPAMVAAAHPLAAIYMRAIGAA